MPDLTAAVQRQRAAPRRVNRPGTLRHSLRVVANGLLLIAATVALTALVALSRDAEESWFFVKAILVFVGPAMMIYLFTRPRDFPPEASTPSAEELIAAEAAASVRAAQQQAELNAGQRHLAELEALNASTEQQLVLDAPQPYAQLGQSPFRDHFVPLEQRVLRPDKPVVPLAPRATHAAALARPLASTPAATTATESLPAVPKLLK